MNVIILDRQTNMSLQTQSNFIKWLDEMENKKGGWTDYRLSAETGLSSSVFSKARQGILPKWDALVRIAVAFNVSPITAFRKAGLLPEGGENASFEDWQYLLNQLPPQEQEEVRKIVEMKIERRQKEEQSARSAQFKPKKA